MDELELLKRVAPVVDAPDPASKAAARRALRAAAASSMTSRRWRPALRPRRAVILGLAAALVAVVLARGPLPLLSPADPAAVAALHQAAEVARAPEPIVLGDGYIYTKTDALWAFMSDKFTYLRPLTREFWMAADGSGRIRETVGEPIFLSEADRQAFVDGGFQVFGINEDFGPGQLSSLAGELPTDVDDLREVLRSRAAETHPLSVEPQMLVLIGDHLRDPLTPPDVRASLFEVAATLPSIQLLGEMRDEAGRTGVGVSLTQWFEERILIFDPATSALLEERTIHHLPHGDTPAPFVWGRATYLESAVVPELPEE